MITHIPKLLETLLLQLQATVDCAVLGMSGGADSTLVSILCQKALGPQNVYSLHMPMNENDENTFNARSLKVAHTLGIHALILPIHNPVNELNGLLSKTLGEPLSILNAGNTRSRIRMSALYGLSHALSERFSGKKVRVIGTGNLSEDFIGYDTKGGDALADIFPIGELFKSEVYQLLDHFKNEGLIEESMIDRVPSAGLWAGQTDEEELGASYNDMEKGIRKALKDDWGRTTPLDRFVFERHRIHKHKHEAPLVFPLRKQGSPSFQSVFLD